MSKSDLTEYTAKFPYSDEEMLKAVRPRALPIYTEEEAAIREAVLSIGARLISGRRRGGHTDRTPAMNAARRQATIVAIYKVLSRTLSKTPTGTRTVNEIKRKLEQKGFAASVETIEQDIKALGTRALRGWAEPQNKRPWFMWLAPERSKARKKSPKHQPNVNYGCTEQLPENTRREMEAGRRSLAAVKENGKLRATLKKKGVNS